jgi:hypothetical protein
MLLIQLLDGMQSSLSVLCRVREGSNLVHDFSSSVIQDLPDLDRRQNDQSHPMEHVCEVPVLIEQRLFALARAIQQSLE